MSWWYSTILIIPLLLILGDVLFSIGPDRGGSEDYTIQVIDQVTGAAVPGAVITLAGQSVISDGSGTAKFEGPDDRTVVQIVAEGYQPVYGEIAPGYSTEQSIALRPVSVVAAAPEAGGDAGDQGQVGGATQSADGEPTRQPDVEPTPVPTNSSAASTDSDDADVVASGQVLDADGEGIRGAAVRAGSKFTRTRRDGTFTLRNANVGGGIEIQAPGFAKQVVPAGLDLTITMERQDIKALYLSGTNAGKPEFVAEMIELIDSTELNAVVIDTKESVVWYDTQVDFFRDADVVYPTYDPAILVKQFEDRGIYTIARQVVFKDPLVAEAYPNLAIKDEQTGEIWRGWAGDAWVNPFLKELWQPNIDMAIESAKFGFDEIQYDYIRFPSDGDLTRADFGPNYTQDGRVAALAEFLDMTRDQLTPIGAMFAIDIFGIVAVYDDDQGIGQLMRELVKHVDYVCPMVYPSHFDAASIDVGGEPNAFPYETIQLSMALAKQKAPGMELKIRPWLQEFTYGEPPYGVEEVRAQIQATEDEGLSGWMMWNANNVYTEDAYRPE